MQREYAPHHSHTIKKTLSLVLTAVLATTLLLPVSIQSAYAEPTAAEKQAEADEASAALAAAEEQALQVTGEYFTAGAAHEEAVALMDEAQERIDAAEALISTTQERLGARANQMYKDGQLSFLEVLFGAASFEEFTTTWDLINTINQENIELIQTNKEARAEAEAAHEEYAAQEKAAAERLSEAEAAKTKSEELVADQQAIVLALSAEVAALLDQEAAARVSAIESSTSSVNSSPAGGGSSPVVGSGTPAAGGGYADVVSAALSRVGCSYVYGATGPNSFDCSGLTSWSYAQAGRGSIGRDTSAQFRNASSTPWPYSSGGAQPGDVLWWPNMPHVAIYIGGGQYVHAATPELGVCISSWDINNTLVLRF